MVSNQTRVEWPLRAALGLAVVLNLACVATVFLRPDNTGQNFAWDIRPAVMAAALGAFYFAAAPMLVAGLIARTWQQVRVIVVPMIGLTTATLLATLFHLSRFRTGSTAARLWLAGYIIIPPVLALLGRRHQQQSDPVGTGPRQPIPARLRSFFRINGLSVCAAAGLIFLDPTFVQRVSPWGFTDLAARVFASWLIGFGLLQISVGREIDWDRAKTATLFLIVLPSAMAVQLWRFREQVDFGNGFLIVLLADLVVTALASMLLWVATETVAGPVGTRSPSGSARDPDPVQQEPSP